MSSLPIYNFLAGSYTDFNFNESRFSHTHIQGSQVTEFAKTWFSEHAPTLVPQTPHSDDPPVSLSSSLAASSAAPASPPISAEAQKGIWRAFSERLDLVFDKANIGNRPAMPLSLRRLAINTIQYKYSHLDEDSPHANSIALALWTPVNAIYHATRALFSTAFLPLSMLYQVGVRLHYGEGLGYTKWEAAKHAVRDCLYNWENVAMTVYTWGLSLVHIFAPSVGVESLEGRVGRYLVRHNALMQEEAQERACIGNRSAELRQQADAAAAAHRAAVQGLPS